MKLYHLCYNCSMKIERTINEILNEKPLSIEYIKTGLTNDNYHVITQNRNVVIRIPRIENHGLFNYVHEQKVLKMLEHTHLDTPLVYFNSKSGIKINEFIGNHDTFSPQYLERAAILIKTLHQQNLTSGIHFDLLKKFDDYKNRVANPIFDTSFAFDYLKHAAEISSNHILCHNDLVAGNLLFTDNKDYLIDYEYAMDNDPFFDIMSFITENDIQDVHLRAQFYDIYFGRPLTENDFQRLELFEVAHHTLWCEWAMMMFESSPLPIYQEIAQLKYRRLTELFTDPNITQLLYIK